MLTGKVKESFEEWLKAVKSLAVKTKIINSSTELDASTWRVYFSDGLNPYDTMVEEFGIKFKRRFRNWSIEREKLNQLINEK